MTFEAWLRRVEETPRATIRNSGGLKYPYKDALLAAVLIRIASGKQSSPEVVLDSVLRSLYGNVLKKLFPGGPSGPPDQPFRHLEKSRRAEAVWTLEAEGVTDGRLRVLVRSGAKFTEVTLGQKYREIRPDGRIMGGAMFYLSKGLSEMGMTGLGKVLAAVFAVLCIGGSFGGGNAFQVVQSLGAVKHSAPWLVGNEWMYGLVMSLAVGVVIIGGIQRIAQVADKIVPAMCGLYVLACAYIILVHMGDVPAAIGLIFKEAFDPQAVGGGFIGVMVIGIKRAVFSNEAGIGSAAIAHSAAKVKYPVEEGVVAILEPFIDTIVVCSMTALVIILTGAYGSAVDASDGAALTSQAMGGVVSWFPHVLSVAVLLFAFSTMISWSYYGERCWAYLFGDGSSMIYRVLFLIFTFLGSIVTATNILDFSDLMILAMAFPNILGVLMLSGKVRTDLTDYIAKLESGEIKKVQ